MAVDGVDHKVIPVGPQTDNECCVCCDKCWNDSSPHIWELDTHMKCQDIAGPGGEHIEGECYPIYTGLCPASCCACPPLGALCLTLSTDQCPVLDGAQFQLTSRPYGVDICSGHNPITKDGHIECYIEGLPYADMTLRNGIQMYNNDHEKWGWSGWICDDIFWPGCEDDLGVPIPTRGEHLMISLCCCDSSNEFIYATRETPADCHTCSYRLTFEWQDNNCEDPWPDGEQACTCPSDEYEDKVIPPNDVVDPPTILDEAYIDWDFYAGQCLTGNPSPDTPFVLVYELNNKWYNCDCCMNGFEEGDDTVSIMATITEVDPDDPEDCEQTWDPGGFICPE